MHPIPSSQSASTSPVRQTIHTSQPMQVGLQKEIEGLRHAALQQLKSLQEKQKLKQEADERSEEQRAKLIAGDDETNDNTEKKTHFREEKSESNGKRTPREKSLERRGSSSNPSSPKRHVIRKSTPVVASQIPQLQLSDLATQESLASKEEISTKMSVANVGRPSELHTKKAEFHETTKNEKKNSREDAEVQTLLTEIIQNEDSEEGPNEVSFTPSISTKVRSQLLQCGRKIRRERLSAVARRIEGSTDPENGIGVIFGFPILVSFIYFTPALVSLIYTTYKRTALHDGAVANYTIKSANSHLGHRDSLSDLVDAARQVDIRALEKEKIDVDDLSTVLKDMEDCYSNDKSFPRLLLDIPTPDIIKYEHPTVSKSPREKIAQPSYVHLQLISAKGIQLQPNMKVSAVVNRRVVSFQGGRPQTKSSRIFQTIENEKCYWNTKFHIYVNDCESEQLVVSLYSTGGGAASNSVLARLTIPLSSEMRNFNHPNFCYGWYTMEGPNEVELQMYIEYF
eukprot:TRINITY_DN1566_c0_g1_i4.p1 TRINITY_DN1566_c0_g1~~TRINITY_DN1566_c0_g1_i4.p1  ORF type:complete len:596 (-),score=86.05 TRINITY_DN1566_c0_g1_i4:148-1680(-)